MVQLITEAELQESVIQVAREFGWLVYHTSRSDKSEPGFTDLVLVRPPRVIFAECKGEKGQLTKPKMNSKRTRELPGQTTWRDALCACSGVEWRLWRPSDLDAIYETLI